MIVSIPRPDGTDGRQWDVARTPDGFVFTDDTSQVGPVDLPGLFDIMAPRPNRALAVIFAVGTADDLAAVGLADIEVPA